MKRIILSILCLALGCAIALCEVNKTLTRAQSMYHSAKTEAEYKAAKNKFQSAYSDPGYVQAEHQAAIQKGIKDCEAKIAQLSAPKVTLTINSVEFGSEDIYGNTKVAFGETLYSDIVCYLKSLISYTSTKTQNKTVYYKYIDPKGALMDFYNSPQGFTGMSNITFSAGTHTIDGDMDLGSVNPSFYPGVYRLEMWIDGKRVYSTSFEIAAPALSITSVEFGSVDYDGNLEVDYGSPLYKKDVRYVKPRITYNSGQEQKKTVYYKFFWPGGGLIHNDDDPEGYTSKQDVAFKLGRNSFTAYGRGYRDPGNYTPGVYKFEVWIDGKCSYSTTFEIKESLAVKEVEFGSTDYDNNVLIDFGSPLYQSSMRYLKPRVTFVSDKAQTKDVYIKIIRPDGTLESGNDSPYGYTYKDTFEIDKGTWIYKMPGWGRNERGAYTTGVYRFEIWIDGKRLYSGKFEIL